MFDDIRPGGVDALMALMQAFMADPRPGKIDLVVGVYKDESGRVPILGSVKEAEGRLLAEEDTKTYVGILGDRALAALVPGLVFGDGAAVVAEDRVRSLQTPGGCGALKVGFDFLASLQPGMRVWMGTPTWANHAPIAEGARLRVMAHPYFRAEDRGLDFEGMMDRLERDAAEGDAILLHACCHNPTGVDLSPEQWEGLGDLLRRKRILPFVDSAYQGFGRGLEEDMAGLRHLAGVVPEMLVATSFSKNFGIYRERAGALSVVAGTPGAADRALQGITSVVRANYSMPPSHGGRIVVTVLTDAALRARWLGELAEMRERIAGNRRALRAALEARQAGGDMGFLTDQVGMFSYTGLGLEQVRRLRDEYAIFVAEDGRINVAGLTGDTMDRVAEGFAAVLR